MESTEKIMKTAIGIVGLPGAGKSIVSEVGREIDIPTIVMGDVIRQICADSGLEINPENLGEIMIDIRKKEGMDVVAKRTLLKLSEVDEDIVIIDGLRSYEEVHLFRRSLKKFLIIAIHAAPKTRYKRIKRRRRHDDPWDYRKFQERDFREIEVGIAKIIALADIVFINEGRVRALKQRIKKTLQLIRDGRWR